MEELLNKNFKELVLNETPLIDVRAPIEFAKGAFKTSVNLPIMVDEERHLVGIEYKKKGNEAATALGHSLVSGEIRQERIAGWKQFVEEHPNTMLNCFRGGSRSQIAQDWICQELGYKLPRLEGGYKAFRNYLLESLEPEAVTMKPIVIGGYTGSGKTLLLNKLNNVIDLEAIANHRGSSFGRHVTAQPTQINFENNLAYELIQAQEKGFEYMVLEDESVHVGSCYIPRPLFEYFKSGELIVLSVSMERRIDVTLDEYVTMAQKEHIEYVNGDVEQGLIDWLAYIVGSVQRLKRSLGEERMAKMVKMVEQAFAEQQATGSVEVHRDWIEVMLREYYDPMYKYQLEHTTKHIVFEGNEEEVLEVLKEKYRSEIIL